MTEASNTAYDTVSDASFTARKFLIVEDEAVIAIDIENFLVGCGHEVLDAAATVQQAIEKIGKMHDKIDGVILDVNLRGESSRPVADALEARNVPYVVTSAYSGASADAYGFKSVDVRKPFSDSELGEAISRIVGA